MCSFRTRDKTRLKRERPNRRKVNTRCKIYTCSRINKAAILLSEIEAKSVHRKIHYILSQT